MGQDMDAWKAKDTPPKEGYMPKFKEGEKVRVRSDLATGTEYRMSSGGGGIYANRMMVEFRGEVVTIAWATRNQYRIVEDNRMWYWTDDMFVALVEEDNRDTLLRTMVVAWEMGDMEWYWELTGRLKKLEVTC